VKPFAVLDLGVVDDDAGCAVDAVEVALFRFSVDGGDPKDIAFDIDALDVMQIALKGDGLQEGERGGEEEHGVQYILNTMATEVGAAYQRIAGRLRKAILDGRLAPGGKVVSERALAAQQGVSLMTARRALVELEKMGLVTRRVGAGTFVAPARSGVRRLRDPHEEFHAPTCVLTQNGTRVWRDGKVTVVEERVTLTGEGAALGSRPLLEFLGDAAVFAAEEIWAEGELLRVRQTIYGPGQEVMAVREMDVRGRRLEGWVGR
jgi:DNA-binding transcriptional regulator YhcF (GntR family)